MEYVDELKNFKELYNMFIYKAEASVFLDTVKNLHLKDFREIFEERKVQENA